MNMDPPCGIVLRQGGIFNMREYDVMMGDKAVGKAEVEREGLYYRIRVRCSLSGDVLYKVLCRCGGSEVNLGVLVPVDGAFGLETRQSIKKLGEGDLRFVALPRHTEMRGKFVPLSPEEPFRYISRLKDSFLTRRNGTTGLIIKEPGCG